MFCNNCGKEINNNAAICPYCGVVANKQALAPEQRQRNTIAIVCYIMSFFYDIVVFIFT